MIFEEDDDQLAGDGKRNSILKSVTNQAGTSTGSVVLGMQARVNRRKLPVNCEPSRQVLGQHIFVLSLEIINSHLIFDRDLLDMPCSNLTNPRKLSFPSVCRIQSCRTTCSGTEGLRPSSEASSSITIARLPSFSKNS